MTFTLLRSGVLAAACLWTASAHAGINPARLLVLDIERAGERLVATGERGVVLLSDDAAAQWRAVRSPTTRTLTAVAFADASLGIAVGHGGTLLRTTDGGASWTAIDVGEFVYDDSLLNVTFLGNGRFVAVGAFGAYLESTDGGQTWTRQPVLPEEGDAHLAALFRAGPQLFIAGEAGTLLRSDDDGASWSLLPSPYEGSFFGGLATPAGAVLVYGMRGKVWRSTDGGAQWIAIDLDTTAAINGATVLPDGRILLSGNGGTLRISADDGASFTALRPGVGDLAHAVAVRDGTVLAAGAAGIARIELLPLESSAAEGP